MGQAAITMDDRSFHFFQTFLREYSGYQLQEDKRYLLESRVRRMLAEKQIASPLTLISALEREPRGAMAQAFIEMMTINETLFFRDARIFTNLQQYLLPEFLAQGRDSLRFWSAACATGQEPYTIAMTMEEARNQYPQLQYHILATDINQQVLRRAQAGIFNEFEIKRGLTESQKTQYFHPQGEDWQIRPALRQRITFRPYNLKETLPFVAEFDVIFLRNVLIYFDDNLKQSIIQQCWNALKPGGALALGGTESIARLAHPFPRFADEYGYYRKNL